MIGKVIRGVSALLSPRPAQVPKKAELLSPALRALSNAPPVGFTNSGSDCCFISLFQLLAHTPSYAFLLEKIRALSPLFNAYATGLSPASLYLPAIRREVGLSRPQNFHPTHDNPTPPWEQQQDPTEEYFLPLLEQAQCPLLPQYKRRLPSPGEAPPPLFPSDGTSHLIVTLPASGAETLTPDQLIANAMQEKMEGYKYDPVQDRMVETRDPRDEVVSKKTLACPPQDFFMQIQRCGYGRTQLSSFFLIRWLQQCLLFILRLLGCEPLPSLQPYKTFDQIQLPLHLTLRKEHVEGQTQDSIYRCQGFISHRGSSTRWGHYVCYVKVQGQWYLCNDDSISPVSEQEAEIALQKTGYLVSYGKEKS